MDELDKAIIIALEGNCRLSYQVLARRLGVTYNAIKKRVTRLLEVGAIKEFAMELSLAMLDADVVYADIVTDRSEYSDHFMEQLGQNRHIEIVWKFADGSYCAFSQVVGVQGLLELGQFLRRFSEIKKIEFHPAVPSSPMLSSQSKINTRGQKVTFTSMQLQVLRCLVEDPRMSITNIARQSRLTPRRIRTILKELQEGGGLYFTIRWDRSAFGDVDLNVRIQYDDTTTAPSEIFEWFKDQYPFEYWASYIWGNEPIVTVFMIVTDLRAAEDITSTVKTAPFTQDVNVRVIYPNRKFEGLGHKSLRDLLIESGAKAK